MFTGIIEEIGKIKEIRKGRASACLSIQAAVIPADIRLGDSVAVNGVCLTVTAFSKSDFTADVMHETLRRSSLGQLRVGSLVNLERAMPANGRFGGHIVTGHIDGTGIISAIQKDDNAICYTVKTGPQLLRYIIEKGSIALDGVSLTVAGVLADGFCVCVIPHTASQTVLPGKSIGDSVNLENDCIGKYVERLLNTPPPKAVITAEFLAGYGF